MSIETDATSPNPWSSLNLLLLTWEAEFETKKHIPKFAKCIPMIRDKTKQIFLEMKDLQKNRSPEDFDRLLRERLEHLNQFSKTCFFEGSKAAEEFEFRLKHPYPDPQKDCLTSPPAIEPCAVLQSNVMEGVKGNSSYRTAHKTDVFVPPVFDTFANAANDLLNVMGVIVI